MKDPFGGMDISAFLRSRTYRVGRVVFHGGHKGWLLVTVPVLALILPALATISIEYRNRWTGFLLQVAGLLLVAWGIRSTRKLFGRPGLGTQLWEWYLNLLTAAVSSPPARTISLSGTARITLGGAAVLGVGAQAPRTVEERLLELEREVVDLRLHVNRQDKELGKRIDSAVESASKESALRKKETDELKAVLEAQSTGGLTLEVIGLVWLVLGAAFSGFPGEMPCLLRCH